VNRIPTSFIRAAAIAALLPCGADAAAQTVGGTVMGDLSRRPLSAVRVRLVDSVSAAAVDSATTDSTGVFYLSAPKAGTYAVEFLRAHAVPHWSLHWRLGSDGFQQASFVLPEGIERTAYAEADVDKPAAPVPRNTAPRYPPDLRNRGMNGNVRVQFIIDTTGTVVEGSLKILFATAPEFGEATRDASGSWKFYPAKKGAALVRQIVCMPLTFRVEFANAKALDAQWDDWRAHPTCPGSRAP
jgi:TonB family protein